MGVNGGCDEPPWAGTRSWCGPPAREARVKSCSLVEHDRPRFHGWTNELHLTTLKQSVWRSLFEKPVPRPRMTRPLRSLTLGASLALATTACNSPPGAAAPGARVSADSAKRTGSSASPIADASVQDSVKRASAVPKTVPFRIPTESEIKDTVVLASIRRGKALMVATRDSLPRYVGNDLRCISCHLGAGIHPNAMPFIGVYSRFPQYRSRAGKVQVLEDRINDCFERSMSGRALPRDGRDMHDIITYMAFLSRGVPVGADVEGQGFPRIKPVPADTGRGLLVFQTTCAKCHGPAGEGTKLAPPLWGPRSFNIGAGMARLNTAASFIRALMPNDNPGTLTDQQAFDVAAYVTSRPRPDFARKAEDWPNGDPPADVAYRVKSMKK
jgi:thiosulfate dehydrogenase